MPIRVRAPADPELQRRIERALMLRVVREGAMRERGPFRKKFTVLAFEDPVRRV